MNIRLAFAGASGTGKSTLAHYVATKYGIPMNPVGARSVAMAMGFSTVYQVDQAGKRREFQHRLLFEKLAWEEKHDDFVTDRTTLDNVVYSVLHADGDLDAALPRDEFEAAKMAIGRYSTGVVFCPIAAWQALDADPNRKSNPIYHAVYESLLEGLLYHERPLTVMLANTSLDERKHVVDSLITGDRSLLFKRA